MQDINQRFDRIEERLLDIESKLGIQKARPSQNPDPKPTASAPATSGADGPVASAALVQPDSSVHKSVSRPAASNTEPVSATRLMAWCGALTFMLATVYFLKLVYDTGWLTPERQVGFAALVGMALIASGLYYQHLDRAYTAFLPALGLIVLYLSCFAAYPYYDLISQKVAIVSVGVVSILGLWLGRRLDNSVYVILAALGVYLTPLLMGQAQQNLLDLVIYYTAWSLLFSFNAAQDGRRISYLLPMYLALLGFDLAWRNSGKTDWVLASSYQLIQFLIFSISAAMFSVIQRQAMSKESGFVHGLALLIFYGIEYAILNKYLPSWAPFFAIGSAVFVVALFMTVKRALQSDSSLEASAAIVSAYCSFVTVHAVFIELIPHQWLPWAVLILPLLFLPAIKQQPNSSAVLFPPIIGSSVLFLYGFISLVQSSGTTSILLPNVALLAYALMLYTSYWLFSRNLRLQSFSVPLLYAAHLALMTATIRIIDSNLMLSVVWAALAIVLLLGAIRIKDKSIGQSALLIFFASGLKVILYDLSDRNSMVRVLILIVLSVSLYAGGWLYQSLVQGIMKLHPNPIINKQLNTIYALVKAGQTDHQILNTLKTKKIEYLGEGEWSLERVANITKDYRADDK